MAEIPEEAYPCWKAGTSPMWRTINADGSPQVTPVWVDHDGDTVLINTARGRIKEKNLRGIRGSRSRSSTPRTRTSR